MSGHSALRLCLVAMAPALTEAASARLKLQESTTKDSPAKLDHNIINNSKSQCSCPTFQKHVQISSRDLSALGGQNRSTGDRGLAHLSFSNGTRGITEQTRPPPTPTPVEGEGLPLMSDAAVNKAKHITLKLKDKDLKFLLDVKEDFQPGYVRNPCTFFDNLKRMNQPVLAAEDHKAAVLNTNKYTIIQKPTCGTEKISKLDSGMVNGDNEQNPQKEVQDLIKICRPTKSGDSHDKQENRNNVLEGKNNLNPAKTQFEKMGRPICMKDATSEMTELSKVISDVRLPEKNNEDIRKDCAKKQAYLERKVDILLRRLKRIKGKVAESHTKEQLRQFVNFQHKSLQTVAKNIKNEAPGPEELKEHFLSNDEVKNMSTAQLVKLVRGYQSNKTLTTAENATKYKMTNSNTVIMNKFVRHQCLTTSEKLDTTVRHTEAELDSDATASSSGAESADEDVPLPSNPDVTPPPIFKRAEWKWAVERSAVVARWTWLQAQVTDLEYKIRQQSQVHRQLRNSKGGVVLGDQPTPTDFSKKLQGLPLKQDISFREKKDMPDNPQSSEVSPCTVSSVMSNIDKQASRLTQSLKCISPAASSIGSPPGSKISSPLVNGLSDSPASNATEENALISSSTSRISEQPLPDATCQAARCRPLRSYRKRKILRTIGLYKTNPKAARLSDVRCRCYPPSNPCPMCGGRYNNTLTMDPESMSFNERVALLDSSFHPVLSFPQDVQLPIHHEGLLKSGLWQNKPPPRRSRIGDYKRQKVLTLMSDPVRRNGNNRQNGRTNTPSGINFSTKIKNKYEGKSKVKNSVSRAPTLKNAGHRVNKAKRKAAKVAREALKRKEEEDDLEAMFLEQGTSLSVTSKDNLSGSASQSTLKEIRDGQPTIHRKRRVDNSFDINNVVIPHSMAASTRVEQIQYKEIVTPKWRELNNQSSECENDVEDHPVVSSSIHGDHLPEEIDDDEIEDLTDERYGTRHQAPEQEEKKRFRNFLQYPPARRGRARSEFSTLEREAGVNHGEDMGPDKSAVIDGAPDALPTGLEEKMGDTASLPSTPLLNKSLPSYLHASLDDHLDSHSVRRRTVSFCRRDRSSSGLEDFHSSFLEINSLEPWPRRTFPLSEEEFRQMEMSAPPSCEPVHQRVTRRLAEPSGKVYVGGSTEHQEDSSFVRTDSRATSPHPSNESISSVGEDPNDPEWEASDVAKKNKNHRRMVVDDVDPDWTGSDLPKKFKKR